MLVWVLMEVAVPAMSVGPPLTVCDGSDQGWLAFVQSHPEATTFHHPAWLSLLAETYGYRPLVLTLTDARGEVVAGMPLLEVRSRLTGCRFVSLPFTDYCPPLARDAASLARFSAGFADWTRSAGDPRVEIRGAMPAARGVLASVVGVRHILPLEPDSQRVRVRFKRERDKGIRKALREGVDVRLTQSLDGLAAFYRLHCLTRRKLGVPVQPKRFFDGLGKMIIQRDFGFLLLAYKSEQPIAGAVFLSWNGQLIIKYSASDPAQLRFRPNNLVFWTGIEWGCRNGCRLFDFGRTDFDDRGLRDFKSGWASTEVPLEYSYVRTAPPRSQAGLAMRTASMIIRFSPPIVARGLGELFYGHFA
jgi:CelD/BcsL family acetyltransferase involved in cellulose biosynthesis